VSGAAGRVESYSEEHGALLFPVDDVQHVLELMAPAVGPVDTAAITEKVPCPQFSPSCGLVVVVSCFYEINKSQ